VTNFGYTENDKLLSDTNKQNTLINNLISLLKSRNGDGVNFDIEMVRGTQKTNLVSFMRKAATRIKDSIPGAEISMAGPAVDWSNGWDYAQLGQICDYIIFMGYNYYYSGSSTAGPVAPISGSGYTIAWTITDYLNKSVLAKKVWAGFPLYGYDWPVKSSARMDSAIAKGSSRTYTVIKSQYIDTIPAGNKFFDATYNVPWYRYTVGTTWRQTWYDDSLSLVKKYQLVNQRNLGGIGFWALSYQGSGTEIWTGVSSSFPLVHAAEVAQLPSDFAIGQNFPNPFNGETNIEVKVKIEAKIEVVVYDLLGREVATIVNEKMNPGVQRIQWNAGNLPSGVYIYRARDGEISDVKKMIVLR
jgi:spore germination protein YaaH